MSKQEENTAFEEAGRIAGRFALAVLNHFSPQSRWEMAADFFNRATDAELSGHFSFIRHYRRQKEQGGSSYFMPKLDPALTLQVADIYARLAARAGLQDEFRRYARPRQIEPATRPVIAQRAPAFSGFID